MWHPSLPPPILYNKYYDVLRIKYRLSLTSSHRTDRHGLAAPPGHVFTPRAPIAQQKPSL